MQLWGKIKLSCKKFIQFWRLVLNATQISTIGKRILSMILTTGSICIPHISPQTLGVKMCAKTHSLRQHMCTLTLMWQLCRFRFSWASVFPRERAPNRIWLMCPIFFKQRSMRWLHGLMTTLLKDWMLWVSQSLELTTPRLEPKSIRVLTSSNSKGILTTDS